MHPTILVVFHLSLTRHSGTHTCSLFLPLLSLFGPSRLSSHRNAFSAITHKHIDTHMLPASSSFIFSPSYTQTHTCACFFLSFIFCLQPFLLPRHSLCTHTHTYCNTLSHTSTSAQAYKLLHLLFYFFSLPHFSCDYFHACTRTEAPVSFALILSLSPTLSIPIAPSTCTHPHTHIHTSFSLSVNVSLNPSPSHNHVHTHTTSSPASLTPSWAWTALFLWPLWAIWSAMSLLYWSPASR